MSKSERAYNEEAEHTQKTPSKRNKHENGKAVSKEIRVEKRAINKDQKTLKDM